MEKKEIVCYKCGKPFSVRQDALSDVCPNCMSFIDVVRAEREKGLHIGACETEKESAEDTLALQDTESEEVIEISEVSTVVEPEIIEKNAEEEPCESKDKTEDLIEQGKEYLEQENWVAACKAFSQSLAIQEDWRGYFGILAAETRDLTNFSYKNSSSYEMVKFHIQKALKTIPEKDRKSLADRYLPRLESKRRELVAEQNQIDSEQNAGKSSIFKSKLPEKQSSEQGYLPIGRIVSAIVLFLFGFIFLFVSFSFVSNFFWITVIMIVFAVALFVIGIRDLKEKKEKERIEDMQTSAQISQRTHTENISRQIDVIDFICGLLKF